MNINSKLKSLETQCTEQGFSIEYGKIGTKSTYCLLTRDREEYVGYTYVRDLLYDNPIIGKLKALTNAIRRYRRSLLS